MKIKLFLSSVLIISNHSIAETNIFFSPRGGCEQQAVKLIKSSQKNLEIAVYSLNSSSIVSAIESAIKRGVHVEVLTDRTQAFGKGNLDTTRKLAGLTQDFRVHTKNRIMHNKFAVSDSKIVMLGSFNWTKSAENSNDENCLLTDDPKVVQAYKNRFETHLWIVNTFEKSKMTLETHAIRTVASTPENKIRPSEEKNP